ncbi:putative tRNA-dihydrouridine synthase [Desulfonema limicola]|uniref:tRNA-dihydrouridine synthase n=1 Tax=Desulfonema limicola TaxID=45656 RepID=A0A975GJ19_9BACT|nr:tRNA dihydrouridine synthase DusB [Desulfonema limicola]QTA83175.1 putative tRNA-dihydrouridine synthase [Desulfonema limicola]
MKIGSVSIENMTVLAPLAGITNLPLRLIAKEAGCGLVCSEMISSNGLVHQSVKTLQLLDSTDQEKPVSIQIFGSDPDIMAEAARMVEESGADILDINFGCSVKKIIKTGSGAALMKTPLLAESILKSVRKAINIPMTIKIRSGWDSSGNQAVHIAKLAEDCGVDAVAVHPRTAAQGFRGQADWSVISRVKQSISIPVLGNGDIIKAEDALIMKKQTNCNGVMIGRAAIGRPWIFSQITALAQGKRISPVEISLRFKTMIHYLDASVKYFGETHACYMMRSRLGWFVKGLPGASHFRESIKHISSEHDAVQLIMSYKNAIAA